MNRSLTLVVVVALSAAACGGSDAEPEADQPADAGVVGDSQDSTAADGGEEADGDQAGGDQAGGDEAGDDGGDQAGGDGGDGGDDNAEPSDDVASGGAASTFSWAAPDGMVPSAIAISPDGSQVAVSFSTADFGSLEIPAEVVVYDSTSGAEVWRHRTEDGGLEGYSDLMFTSAGLTTLSKTFDGVQLIRFDAAGTPNTDVVMDASSSCGQYLNGAVDPSSDVFYTVIPGGYCRVDISTGATTELAAEDIEAGSQRTDSIRFGTDGTLVASFPNADFEPQTVAIDPVSFTAQGDAGQPEPATAGDLYGDRLEQGMNLTSDSRATSTPDGSVTALLQLTTIEIIR